MLSKPQQSEGVQDEFDILCCCAHSPAPVCPEPTDLRLLQGLLEQAQTLPMSVPGAVGLVERDKRRLSRLLVEYRELSVAHVQVVQRLSAGNFGQVSCCVVARIDRI